MKRYPQDFYFNINYICNSRCVFCASDNAQRAGCGRVTFRSFKEVLEKGGIGPGDKVTINGGEPTLSRDLRKMIALVASRGAACHLFTNGRRLAERGYAIRLMKGMRGRILIPLFAPHADVHDAMTGVRGSYAETMQGIKNVFELRERGALDTEVELRLLFARPLLPTLPALARMVLTAFPGTDAIGLNTLILSSTAMARRRALVPTIRELRKTVRDVLDVLAPHPEKINLVSIPICQIPKEHIPFLENNHVGVTKYLHRYFGPEAFNQEGILRATSNETNNYVYEDSPDNVDLWKNENVDRLCAQCELRHICLFKMRPWMLRTKRERAGATRIRNGCLAHLKRNYDIEGNPGAVW